MRKFIVLYVIFVALIYVAAPRASYGYMPFDEVASAIAGHPVLVQCGSDALDWSQTERAAGLTFDTDGFTTASLSNVIYLAPRICDTLKADLTVGPNAVGAYWNGDAIRVIVHESLHQRGLVDESTTDCTALTLVKQYALSFGYTQTVKQTTYVKLKSGAYKRVVKVVPNPALASLYSWAVYWHKLLPASYQVVC